MAKSPSSTPTGLTAQTFCLLNCCSRQYLLLTKWKNAHHLCGDPSVRKSDPRQERLAVMPCDDSVSTIRRFHLSTFTSCEGKKSLHLHISTIRFRLVNLLPTTTPMKRQNKQNGDGNSENAMLRLWIDPVLSRNGRPQSASVANRCPEQH